MSVAKKQKRTPTLGDKVLDGRHPLQDKVPEITVNYQARVRAGAKVRFFNFQLAKEMGIVAQNAPNKLTGRLTQDLIETFGIVIINEYDIENEIEFDASEIYPNSFMATRYLQLQHPNKQGLTSGDGRSVWNGQIEHEGMVWDVSSCGTGATSLSPATHIYEKHFQTGDPSISYGCGYSEVDEGFSSLLFSEVLHHNGISTERILAVLEYDDGIAINVRAYPNLLRPSHFFRPLKLGRYEELKKLFKYHYNVQVQNGGYLRKRSWEDQLEHALKVFATDFGTVSATFEDEYLFVWFDWDGDNILMDGGIIDYGSVRQFGLYHHEYRYDDVQRFSTTIAEQKSKARVMVQTFAQAIEYLKSGKRPTLKDVSDHWALELFEESFEETKDRNILYKLGVDQHASTLLMQHNRKLVKDFRKVFHYFEKVKSRRGKTKVADGITWDAIFCMRDILRELPQIYQSQGVEQISDREFVSILASNYATAKDRVVGPSRSLKIKTFQKLYNKIVDHYAELTEQDRSECLLNMTLRSSTINKYDRITGDSVSLMVDQIIGEGKNATPERIFEISQELKTFQTFRPERNSYRKRKGPAKGITRRLLKIVRNCREGI